MQAHTSSSSDSSTFPTRVDDRDASVAVLTSVAKDYSEYWATSLCSGLVALLFATAILIIPALASVILLVPFAIILCILCLAAYGFIDSALVFATSFMIPQHGLGRLALRLQGALGVSLAVLLFSLAYERVDVRWFLYIAAFQAGQTAIAEVIVAKGTAAHHKARWCYVSAAIAILSCLALLLGRNAAPPLVAWLLFGYLGVFGFNLFSLSASMLVAERRVLPRVKHASPRV